MLPLLLILSRTLSYKHAINRFTTESPSWSYFVLWKSLECFSFLLYSIYLINLKCYDERVNWNVLAIKFQELYQCKQGVGEEGLLSLLLVLITTIFSYRPWRNFMKLHMAFLTPIRIMKFLSTLKIEPHLPNFHPTNSRSVSKSWLYATELDSKFFPVYIKYYSTNYTLLNFSDTFFNNKSENRYFPMYFRISLYIIVNYISVMPDAT